LLLSNPRPKSLFPIVDKNKKTLIKKKLPQFMANFDFPIFDKKFCARVDKKDKNLIRRPLLTREKPLEKNGERCRGCGKIHTKNAF